MPNAQTISKSDTNTDAAEVIKDSKLLSELESATKARKEAYDKYVASLPQATVEHVKGVCKSIKNGDRASTSVPRVIEVGEELVVRIDKDTPAYEEVEATIKRRKKYLKSKNGRAKVDETVSKMTCTSFTLRTKKNKDGSTSSKANVVFES